MEKDILRSRSQKKSKVSNNYIGQNLDFKPKMITKINNVYHYIMINRSIHYEDITVINIYAPTIGAPKYIKQILTNMKREIDHNTTLEDFSIPLSTVHRPDRKSRRKQWT